MRLKAAADAKKALAKYEPFLLQSRNFECALSASENGIFSSLTIFTQATIIAPPLLCMSCMDSRGDMLSSATAFTKAAHCAFARRFVWSTLS